MPARLVRLGWDFVEKGDQDRKTAATTCSSADLWCPGELMRLSRESVGQDGQGWDGQRRRVHLLCCCWKPQRVEEVQESAQWRGVSAPLHLGIDIALFRLILHTFLLVDRAGAKEESGLVRGYRTHQHRIWEETYSWVEDYWFFNCRACLNADRVLGIKWDTGMNHSQ